MAAAGNPDTFLSQDLSRVMRGLLQGACLRSMPKPISRVNGFAVTRVTAHVRGKASLLRSQQETVRFSPLKAARWTAFSDPFLERNMLVIRILRWKERTRFPASQFLMDFAVDFWVILS
jgi:hypothetical protein